MSVLQLVNCEVGSFLGPVKETILYDIYTLTKYEETAICHFCSSKSVLDMLEKNFRIHCSSTQTVREV